MANTIKPKRTTTPAKVPTTADLDDGEMAVNIPDKKIYMRNGSSVEAIADMGGGGGGAPTVVLVNTSVYLGATHLNSMCEKTSAGTTTLYLLPSYGTPGDAILFVNNSTGNLVINRGPGVMLMTYGSNANLTIPANRAALIVRTSTANKWIRA